MPTSRFDSRFVLARRISLDPRVERVVSSGVDGGVRCWRRGRIELERRSRERVLAEDAGVWPPGRRSIRLEAEGFRIDVELAPRTGWTASEVRLHQEELVASVRLPRGPADDDARERLHDVAHGVTQARLLAEGLESEAKRSFLEALSACGDALDGDERTQPIAGSTALGEFLANELRRAASARRGATQVRLKLRVDAELSTSLPRAELARIVRNLVVNALEASPNEAAIEVEAREPGPGRREVCVRDEGRGLSSWARAELFTGGVASRGGTGLGTRSVAACAARLGARLSVEGGPGSGTCVRVEWSEPRGPWLALVADAPFARLRAAAAFEARGFHVLAAEQSKALLRAPWSGAARRVARWLVARGTRDEQLVRAACALAAGGRVVETLGLCDEPRTVSRRNPPSA